MSETGIIFDIKQFAVFDGPGIRTTVFMKGCPLRCEWCHNPEGLLPSPQLMISHSSCIHCGNCRKVCSHPDQCVLCGDCIKVCPLRLRKICGTIMTSDELAEVLLRDQEYLKAEGGGVTFSGGEPTMQPKFLTEVLKKIPDMHRVIETCGYCPVVTFAKIIGMLDFVIMDIKVVNPVLHKKYTGVDNALILHNLEFLKKSGKPFMIRIPLIPGVNDSEENFIQTARLLESSKNLTEVQLLPYHKTAGAKYSMVNKTYQPNFDANRKPNLDTSVFTVFNVPCSVI